MCLSKLFRPKHLKITDNLNDISRDYSNQEDYADKIREFLKSISSSKILTYISENATDYTVRNIARNKSGNELSTTALADIVLHDHDAKKRMSAIKRITSQDIIAHIALNSNDKEVCGIAETMLINQDLIIKLVWNENYKSPSIDKLLNKISNPEEIEKVGINHPCFLARRISIRKIENQSVLIQIAKNDKENGCRQTATDNMSDQVVLKDIVLNDSDFWVRINAIGNITNVELLNFIAKNDKNLGIRDSAQTRLQMLRYAGFDTY